MAGPSGRRLAREPKRAGAPAPGRRTLKHPAASQFRIAASKAGASRKEARPGTYGTSTRCARYAVQQRPGRERPRNDCGHAPFLVTRECGLETRRKTNVPTVAFFWRFRLSRQARAGSPPPAGLTFHRWSDRGSFTPTPSSSSPPSRVRFAGRPACGEATRAYLATACPCRARVRFYQALFQIDAQGKASGLLRTPGRKTLSISFGCRRRRFGRTGCIIGPGMLVRLDVEIQEKHFAAVDERRSFRRLLTARRGWISLGTGEALTPPRSARGRNSRAGPCDWSRWF